MKRWKDTGSVRFDSVPEGRVWIGRRKPVSIPDGKPWAVAWRERARLRVEFARSHRDAMRFAAILGGDPA